MSDRKVILYIAMSLDGYIARENSDISWLSVVEKAGEDYGYSEFIDNIDTVIMGRKTYEKVMSFGIEFPHKDKKCYVISRTKKGLDENVEYYSEGLENLITHLKNTEGKNIFVVGIKTGLKFQSCKPSAHYQLPLLSGCIGQCQYCYLNTNLGDKPYMRINVNVDDILTQADLPHS